MYNGYRTVCMLTVVMHSTLFVSLAVYRYSARYSDVVVQHYCTVQSCHRLLWCVLAWMVQCGYYQLYPMCCWLDQYFIWRCLSDVSSGNLSAAGRTDHLSRMLCRYIRCKQQLDHVSGVPHRQWHWFHLLPVSSWAVLNWCYSVCVLSTWQLVRTWRTVCFSV